MAAAAEDEPLECEAQAVLVWVVVPARLKTNPALAKAAFKTDIASVIIWVEAPPDPSEFWMS